jgi:6-phosphogluconolactonase (cycloisomerase 2 family)
MHKASLFPAAAAATAALLSVCGQAAGQPTVRAAYVANNGNIEGSVTAYTFTPAGEPVFLNKYVTGAGSNNPGNNAYAISLTPDGMYLATTHATALTIERITLFQVNADGSLEQVGTAVTPDSPLAAVWVSNDLLAVTQTSSSVANNVILYRLNRATNTLTQVDAQPSGSFTGYLAVHPSGEYLFAQDSPLFGSTYTIRTFKVDPEEGTLTFISDCFTSPYYALGLSVTPDGRRIYGGGGISSGGNAIVGFDVDNNGLVDWMPGSPFISPPPPNSPSPKQAIATPDGKFLFVGHGSSSVVRSFAIDEITGNLADTGAQFKVGIQGDLGGIAMLGDWVLFTRKYSSTTYGPTGLMSWTVHPDGTFTPNGTVVSSGGSLPQFIATWNPPGPPECYANCDGSTEMPILNVADFTCFMVKFAGGDPYANCDGSTVEPVLNVADFSCFLSKFSAGCE